MAPYAFISYSSHDKSYVETIAQQLRAGGVETWVDRLGIITGHRWRDELRDAIARCGAVIVVMSPDSERSRWVQEELALAEGSQKPIFPLLLAGQPFFGLATVQHESVMGGAELSPHFVRSVADALFAGVSETEGGAIPLVRRFGARPVQEFDSSAPVRSLAWLRPTTLAADGGNSWTVWDVSSGRQIAAPTSDVIGGTWSPDGRLLVGNPRGPDGRSISTRLVSVDPVGGGRQEIDLQSSVWQWAWRPDSTQVAFADSDAVVWDARRGEVVTRMANTTANKVYCTAWSPDGALLATGHWWKTGDVRIWDAQLGAEVAHLVPKESAREANTLVSWMVWGGRADVLLIGLHSSPYLAPVGHDSAELWNPISGSFVSDLSEGAVEDRPTLALCAERHLVALIDSRTQGVVVRDLYDRKARIPIARADHRATSMAWSPDGAVLAVAYDDGRLCLWS